MGRRALRATAVACLLVVALGGTAAAQEDPVGAADLYQLAALLHGELELVRQEMGLPQDRRTGLEVAAVGPRELYFQSLTLFQRANRLAFEQARERAVEQTLPEMPSGGRPIGFASAYGVLEASIERIRRVKQKLGIVEEARAEPADPKADTTDVFDAVARANRQLDLLLEDPISSSDVYEQVTLAVSYASRLLEHFPGSVRIPPTPRLERRQSPADVQRRLLRCLEQARRLAEPSGISVLKVSPGPSAEVTTAADVYDLASLLVSVLADLHARLGARPPVEPYYPGRKLPAHVHQRVGILEAQLAELERRAKAEAGWLQRRR